MLHLHLHLNNKGTYIVLRCLKITVADSRLVGRKSLDRTVIALNSILVGTYSSSVVVVASSDAATTTSESKQAMYIVVARYDKLHKRHHLKRNSHPLRPADS